jgi:hypothetical protein
MVTLQRQERCYLQLCARSAKISRMLRTKRSISGAFLSRWSNDALWSARTLILEVHIDSLSSWSPIMACSDSPRSVARCRHCRKASRHERARAAIGPCFDRSGRLNISNANSLTFRHGTSTHDTMLPFVSCYGSKR